MKILTNMYKCGQTYSEIEVNPYAKELQNGNKPNRRAENQDTQDDRNVQVHL